MNADPLAVSGFGVAFLLAALPVHWLPFVLAGRGQYWSVGKTLAITAVAGLGHVLFTIAFGIVVVWLGFVTSRLTGNTFPFLAGSILILFGVYYLARQERGSATVHHHAIGHGHQQDQDHDHGDRPAHSDHCPHDRPVLTQKRSDMAVVLGLIALLSFSPCTGFLPLYLAGSHYGWTGFLLLSMVLALAMPAALVIITWLCVAGLERTELATLERYDSSILGGLLVFLGIVVMVFER